MPSNIRAFVFSLVAVGASSLGMAQTQVTVKGEVVNYEDVRLISAVGAAVLYGRLRAAAQKACGVPPDNRQLAMDSKYRACVDDAVSKAVAQVNEPMLTQYFESKRAVSAKTTTNAPPVSASATGAR
jgi:UrcA family protein